MLPKAVTSPQSMKGDKAMTKRELIEVLEEFDMDEELDMKMEKPEAHFVKGYKLFEDTFLGVFEECLAIAKINERGEIVRMTTFGEKGDKNGKAEN